jgi:hypothetical protein
MLKYLGNIRNNPTYPRILHIMNVGAPHLELSCDQTVGFFVRCFIVSMWYQISRTKYGLYCGLSVFKTKGTATISMVPDPP